MFLSSLYNSSSVAAKELLITEISINVVYLMGISFILGTLFTIFILLVLDALKERNSATTPKSVVMAKTAAKTSKRKTKKTTRRKK